MVYQRLVVLVFLTSMLTACTQAAAPLPTGRPASSTVPAQAHSTDAPPPSVAPTLLIPSARVRSPSVPQVVSADIDYAVDEHDLVRRATLVIVGVPTGQVEEVNATPNGLSADFRQTVRVQEVLKGDVSGDTVRVIRAGLTNNAPQQGVIVEDGLRGALPPGKHILFLQPSAELGVFQVVGHASGDLPLDTTERVASVRPETQAFAHLDVASVRTKIVELSARP